MNKNKTNVAQWADSSLNIQYGCQNGCLYCYAQAMAPRHGKTTVENWTHPIPKNEPLQKRFSFRSGITMFPTTHDITPDNIECCLSVLNRLLAPGNKVLVVSKPNFECVKSLCTELEKHKSLVEFRFTIGSIDNAILSFWEPNAPSYTERLESLKYAFNSGFITSVSGEPMLDNHPEKIVQAVEPFVNGTIWLGKANDLIKRLKINHHNDELTLSRAKQLVDWQNDNEILKLYNSFKNHPKIRWKDSIQKVIEKSNNN